MAREIAVMIVGRLGTIYRVRFKVVLLLVLLGSTLLAWSHRFIQDDAFIGFRYAYHLAHGKGLVWNEGERVEGYSNFLYTITMAIPIALGLDPVTFSFAFGVMTFFASLLLTYALARRLLHSRDFALLAVLLLGTNYSFSSYATGGLETQLQAALFVASVLTLVRAMDRHGWNPGALTALSLLLGAALLTRLDSALLVLVVVPVALRCALGHLGHPAGRLARALALLLPVVVVVGAWLAWKLYYYGDILPNTYYVKIGSPVSPSRGARYVYSFLRAYWLVPFPFLLLWCGRDLATAVNRRLVIPFAIVGLWVLYSIRVGGDFMEFRFLVPILPLGFVCMTWMISRMRWAWFRAALSVLVLAGSLYHGSGFGNHDWEIETVRDLASHLEGSDGWVRIGRVLGEALDHTPHVTIALTAGGAIPFYSRLTTIDMLGLNDKWIAKHGLCTGLTAGHQRITTFGYLLARGVNLVIAHPLTAGTASTFALSRTSILRFLPMLSDGETLPAGSRILEIPIAPTRKLFVLYLIPHPRVDAAVERNRWRSYPYDLWERASVERPEHTPVYHAGARIDFTTEQAEPYLWYGWSGFDFKIRWSTGKTAAVVFGLDEPTTSVLRLKMGRFLYSAALSTQRVDLELNGRRVTTLTLSDPEFREYSIALSRDLLSKTNVLRFSAQADRSLPQSDDAPTRLGLKVEWMELRG